MPVLPYLRVSLLLTAFIACRSPTPSFLPDSPDAPGTTEFGRAVVLAKADGEARLLQGRKPIWLKIDPVTVGSQTLTVGTEDLPPGDSIGVHKHLREDEVVYVARGHVTVTLGESTYPATAGGLVFIPRGTWIGFQTAGADTASIVFIFNAPGFEKCLRTFSSPARSAFVPPTPDAVATGRRECHQVRPNEDSVWLRAHRPGA
jgi:quercetin dioxygenase-like cupin family protein